MEDKQRIQNAIELINNQITKAKSEGRFDIVSNSKSMLEDFRKELQDLNNDETFIKEV